MRRLRNLRTATAAAAMAGLVICLSGCGWQGLNTLPLPGTAGRGPGSFEIQAQLPDVNNLERNSRVRVGDVTVGNVTRIERQGWHALVTIRLNGDVNLPENTTIKLGQTSLLGSQHLELVPPSDAPPTGRLRQGSVIPLANAHNYPTTEQTLAAVSMLLNGGSVGQLQEVVQAFAVALRDREQEVRSLIEQLERFVGIVDEQTGDIISATESLNRVTGAFAAQKPVLDRALRTVPEALAVLKEQRTNLTEVIDKLGKLSATKENLVSELNDLAPVLKSLADAGPALVRSLDWLPTFPFPTNTLDNWMRGDYGNISVVFDLTLSRLDAALFTGTRFEGDLTKLELQWGRTIGQMPSPYTSENPLVAPYHLDQGP
ncbi:MCE family protein [Mycolicibacterium thermoresistibile]